MRVLAIVPHRLGYSPGQRVRIESWVPDLRQAGVEVGFAVYESDRLNQVLHSGGRPLRKLGLLAQDWWRQAGRVASSREYDGVIVHREAALVGPALIERIPALRDLPMVYDLDDPVFVPYRSPDNGWASVLKCPGKVAGLVARSRVVSVVNDRIGEFARARNPRVRVVPNFVDTRAYRPRDHGRATGRVRLLWIGSATTVPNLRTLRPVLDRLGRSHEVTLVVVGPPGVVVPGVDVEAHVWSPEVEAAVAATCDVGVVPVPPSPWADWKFYFKVVQYMAAGLPVVADAVGSNRELVEGRGCGRAVVGDDEWLDALDELCGDHTARAELGGRGRDAAEREFDVRRRAPLVRDLIAEAFT